MSASRCVWPCARVSLLLASHCVTYEYERHPHTHTLAQDYCDVLECDNIDRARKGCDEVGPALASHRGCCLCNVWRSGDRLKGLGLAMTKCGVAQNKMRRARYKCEALMRKCVPPVGTTPSGSDTNGHHTRHTLPSLTITPGFNIIIVRKILKSGRTPRWQLEIWRRRRVTA